MSSLTPALLLHPDPGILGIFIERLQTAELQIDTAVSPTEAMNKLRAKAFGVLIVAQMGGQGIDFLKTSIPFASDALRILLVDELDCATSGDQNDDALEVLRFVGDPTVPGRLAGLVREGLKLKELIRQQRALVSKLNGEYKKLQNREKLLDVVVKERTRELEESYTKLKTANRQALFGLAEAIEAKDPYTKGHCGRVAAYSMLLAEASGYPSDGMETLEFGAFLHDIGKIGVRDSVLAKPGPLDDDEWLHMREHPLMGFEIATKIDMLRTIIPAVRNHHERWDGKGYPDGLAGEDIPAVARIVSIADAYDAMATDRPYKQAFPRERCEQILRDNAGKMFDANMVDLFCSHHLGEIYEEEVYVREDEEP